MVKLIEWYFSNLNGLNLWIITVKKLVEIIKNFWKTSPRKQVPKLIPQKNLEKAFPDLP